MLLSGCGDVSASPGDDRPELVPVALHGPGEAELHFAAEVAADPQARRRGLMDRADLPADRGMLFVFPWDTRAGFWMKDTLIPLSIAFADADGEVVEVLDMEPCRQDPCPVHRPRARYRYALEVNQGAIDDVGPGWRLDAGMDGRSSLDG